VRRENAILLAALRDPASMTRLDAAGWNLLIPSARMHGLLARLATYVSDADALPDAARRQFDNATIAAAANQTGLRFEIDRVARALAPTGTRIVLLKGGAFLQAGLPPSRGRSSTDLDILVPRADLPRVEAALIAHGWALHAETEYDEHYYRDWMHEIPPMVHTEREAALDVHHTIFPPVAGIRIDSAALLADAVQLDGGVWALCPTDMVLHSAVHLFGEDITGRLRDLLDLHDLLTHFGAQPGFWDALQARARLHGLARPLAYAVRYSRRFMGTAVPAGVGDDAGPAMDWLVGQALLHAASDTPGLGARIAQRVLYVRGHWLKMPTGMLVRHLWTKWRRREEDVPV